MNAIKFMFPLEAAVLSSKAIQQKLLLEYSIPILTCRLYYRSIHDTYIVRNSDCEFFFKVYRYGLRTKEDILTEIDWISCLKNKGIAVTEPVVKKDGNYVVEFETLQGKRYGVLFTAAGVKSFNQVEETEASNKKLGKYLASVHEAWNSIPISICKRRLDMPNVVDESMKYIREFSNIYYFDLEFLEDVADKLKKKLELLSKNSPEYGVCHGDFYSGNIRFDNYDNPILFDFDFAGVGWRIYDIALFADAFGLGCSADDIIKRVRRKTAFLEGYTSLQILSNEAISSIDLMIPFRRLFNIGTIYIAMSNTFGDEWAIRNTNDDINKLRKWLMLNPVL